jgi:hypothetical protein
MSRRRTRDAFEGDQDDDDEGIPIDRRKTRRQTWLSALHLALNADEQLQLRQLNGQYFNIVSASSLLSLQHTLLTKLAFIVVAKECIKLQLCPSFLRILATQASVVIHLANATE